MTKHLLARVVAVVALTIGSVLAAPAARAAAPVGLTPWPIPAVYVHDSTGDPVVREAVAEWDQLGALRVLYTDQPCQLGTQCVTVLHQQLDPGVGGETPQVHVAGRMRDATVYLNTGYDIWPLSWRLNIDVHELGHALGLPHAPAGVASVMAPVATGTTTGPTAYDAWTLAEAYAPR